MKTDQSIMKKKALITGITGQDGAYLAKFLIDKGYEVHGVKRRSSIIKTDRIDDLFIDPHEDNVNLYLHYGDLTDSNNLTRLLHEIQPDEVYNLAAMSHVRVSFDIPEYTSNVDGIGTLRLLESIKFLKMTEKVKFYQASTSELYGKVQEIPQTEKTPFYPRSPYAVAKLFSYWTVVNYREAYDMFACNGILFNHESPKRGENFVTRKITRGIARLLNGLDSCLYFGNIDAKRDWGHAKDYVKAMWMMLQQDKPEDYVIATGKTHKVRDFISLSFSKVGVNIEYEGNGIDEVGIVRSINKDLASSWLDGKDISIELGQVVLRIDEYYYRPTEVELLIGDPTKAKKQLGWEPETELDELVSEMLELDFKQINFLKK